MGEGRGGPHATPPLLHPCPGRRSRAEESDLRTSLSPSPPLPLLPLSCLPPPALVAPHPHPHLHTPCPDFPPTHTHPTHVPQSPPGWASWTPPCWSCCCTCRPPPALPAPRTCRRARAGPMPAWPPTGSTRWRARARAAWGGATWLAWTSPRACCSPWGFWRRRWPWPAWRRPGSWAEGEQGRGGEGGHHGSGAKCW